MALRSDDNERTVLVEIQATLVQALLRMHASLDADLVGVTQASIVIRPKPCSRDISTETLKAAPQSTRKYEANFLGVPVTASTLPEIFAKSVAIAEEIAPEALDKLY